MRKIAVLIAAMILSLGLAAAAVADSQMTKDELRKLLNDNPDVILDFLNQHKVEVFDIVDAGIKSKQEEAGRKRREAELAKPLSPTIDPSRILAGKPDAPWTVVEYSDFLCQFCARGAKTMDELLKKYPDKVRLVFKHSPHNELSKQAALYFEAIMLQGRDKAKKFLDLAFAQQDLVFKEKEDRLKKMAEEAKADMKRLAEDIKRKDLEERIEADDKEAQDFGFTGTPSYVVNGVSIRGAQPLPAFDEVFKLTGKGK